MSERSERPLVTRPPTDRQGQVQMIAFRDSEQCVLGTVEKKRGKKHHLHAARPVRISAYSSPNNKPTRSYWMEKGRICGKFYSGFELQFHSLPALEAGGWHRLKEPQHQKEIVPWVCGDVRSDTLVGPFVILFSFSFSLQVRSQARL